MAATPPSSVTTVQNHSLCYAIFISEAVLIMSDRLDLRGFRRGAALAAVLSAIPLCLVPRPSLAVPVEACHARSDAPPAGALDAVILGGLRQARHGAMASCATLPMAASPSAHADPRAAVAFAPAWRDPEATPPSHDTPRARRAPGPTDVMVQAKADGVAAAARPGSLTAAFLDGVRDLNGRCLQYVRSAVAPDSSVSEVRLAWRNRICAYRLQQRGILAAPADQNIQNIYLMSGREELRPGYFLIESYFNATDLSTEIQEEFSVAGLPLETSVCAVLSRADVTNTSSFMKFRSIYCLSEGMIKFYYYLAMGMARDVQADTRECRAFPRQLYPAYCLETYHVFTEDWTIEGGSPSSLMRVAPAPTASPPVLPSAPLSVTEPPPIPARRLPAGPPAPAVDPRPATSLPAAPPIPVAGLADEIRPAPIPDPAAEVPASPAAPQAALNDAPANTAPLYVQLGALASEDVARIEMERLNRRLRDLLAGRRIEILRLEPESPSAMLRLRAGRFGDANAARSFCEAVRERRVPCIVIGGPAAAASPEQIAPPTPAASAATVQPAPAPLTPPALSGGAIRVQLGALPSEEAARTEGVRLARRHNDLLLALRLQVQRREREGAAPIFLLRAGPFPSMEAAHALCDQMRERRVPCVVIRG